MVSSTTRPDYLPFLKDIAGFITNEGGTLSHAAILARELKKPCIIGTKFATQVLKDGDIVEVDADNRIARIIEKNKNIFEQDWQLTATRNMPLWHDILCLYGWEDNMRDYGING